MDWADRAATEAKIRAKIKRLLRANKYAAPSRGTTGGAGIDHTAQLVLEQAKALYRYWPDIGADDRLYAS